MKKQITLLPLLFLALITTFVSCTKDAEGPKVNLPFSGDIGDFYQGGVVFYIDSSGEHGLIASPINHTEKVPWGCYGTIMSAPDGAYCHEIGLGNQNTEDIMRFCLANNGIAASICTNLNLNSYDDWFLPSKHELILMADNRTLIEATSISNGGSSFLDEAYWSSSGADPLEYALLYLFDGMDISSGKKDELHNVRAVREF